MSTVLGRYLKHKYIIPLGFVTLFAAGGIILLLLSRAATPFASVEPESGSTTGTTTPTDNKASGGSYVQFGSSSAGSGSSSCSGLLWCGNYETGDLSQYHVNACQNSFGSISAVTSPAPRAGKYAGAFTVTDNSTTANCSNLGSPTHPNDEAISPWLFKPGNDYYIGFSTLFPSNFPVICPTHAGACFFQIAEIYGPPYGGTAPIGIDVVANSAGTANQIFLGRGAAQNFDKPWIQSGSLVADGKTWQDIVLHVHFATDNTGSVQLWFNGVQQTFTNGSTTINYPVLQSGVNWNGSTGDALFNNQYRSAPPSAGGPAGSPSGSITIWHDEANVGTTYAQVAP